MTNQRLKLNVNIKENRRVFNGKKAKQTKEKENNN